MVAMPFCRYVGALAPLTLLSRAQPAFCVSVLSAGVRVLNHGFREVTFVVFLLHIVSKNKQRRSSKQRRRARMAPKRRGALPAAVAAAAADVVSSGGPSSSVIRDDEEEVR